MYLNMNRSETVIRLVLLKLERPLVRIKMLMYNKNTCKVILRYCSSYKVGIPIAKPIVYGDEISPPVRFVAMTASILGIDLEFRKIDLFKNENRSDFYKKINPLQKVPAMMVGEKIIRDSHAISIYLCQIANINLLYPDEPLIRAKVNEMLFFNSSTLFRIDSEILSAYFSKQWPVNEKKIEEWLSALDFLEYQLKTHNWLVGTQMYLCDLSILAVVTSMMSLQPLTERHVNVANWIERFKKYPVYAINERGVSVLYKYIEVMKSVS